jgi:methylenetetrahydrofolate dehydrogenase (NADP+)/methenyltetrahydrofolate cyclohydrolase
LDSLSLNTYDALIEEFKNHQLPSWLKINIGGCANAVSMYSDNTPNLKEKCLDADILCVDAGKPKFITADMIKEGAIVIDLGMNVVSNGKVVGDVDFDSVKEKAAYITPVPGGVGPITVAMILHNTVLASKMQARIL